MAWQSQPTDCNWKRTETKSCDGHSEIGRVEKLYNILVGAKLEFVFQRQSVTAVFEITDLFELKNLYLTNVLDLDTQEWLETWH